jgi:uncharacterized membrane protein YkoI
MRAPYCAVWGPLARTPDTHSLKPAAGSHRRFIGDFYGDEVNEEVEMKRTLAVIAATVLVLVALSAGLAVAAGASGGGAFDRAAALVGRDDDDSSEGADGDESLQGAVAQRAARAALRATGGGTVRGVERGDDGAAYDVEVQRPDGSVVEVQLDAGYNVLRTAAGDED